MGVKQNLCLMFCKSDIFFIQKIFVSEKTLKKIKKKGIRIIFDFDDAIFLKKDLFNIDKKAEANTVDMLKFSDDIIVSTPYLREWVKSHDFKSHIITTPIDFIYLEKRKRKDVFTIGWMGSSTNTVHLEEIKEPLKELAKLFNVRLLLVGANKSFDIEGVNVEHKEWSLEKEQEFLKEMDIGIMPLLKNNYSKGKGGYKIFVYMGAGLPAIATRIGFNEEIIIEGETGFFADSKKDWIKHISFFIENREKLDEFGTKAREIAAKKYSRKVCAEKLVNVLDKKI